MRTSGTRLFVQYAGYHSQENGGYEQRFPPIASVRCGTGDRTDQQHQRGDHGSGGRPVRQILGLGKSVDLSEIVEIDRQNRCGKEDECRIGNVVQYPRFRYFDPSTFSPACGRID